MKTKQILSKIQTIIPYELLDIIYSYITIDDRIFISKEEYKKYYFISYTYTRHKDFNKYIKRVIRNDHVLALSILYDENRDRWKKIRRFRGKIGSNHIKTFNFMHFLKQVALYYQSPRCKLFFIENMREDNIKKNKKLNNTKIKYTRWTN